jgi:CRISPR-associated endonuclease/helicase Cas3
MYPTNELARDQRRQFADYKREFGSVLSFDDLWGAKLGQIVEQHAEFARRAEALAALLQDHQVLLTNPDIFHLMINFRYGSTTLSSVELPARLQAFYKTFIFDEFHLFGPPQITAAVTAMLFINATANRTRRSRPRFLFSSATPSAVFGDLLQASGLRARHIAGTYQTLPGEGYRHVLHGADLHLHRLGEQQSAEQWVADHLALIQEHWSKQAEPRPRGVIIVNSVVEARRIARLLGDRLTGIHVGENTGLTDDERRRAAMREADLIVGTSTIDVGVDFNISLLIFEAPDAGTFLQRFGRLGRVRRSEPPFARYEAHALFSGKAPWIYDAFLKQLTERGVEHGSVVDRPTTLRDAVVAAFPTATDFRRYIRRWGSIQAAHIIYTLENRKEHGTAYTRAGETLRTQYAQALGLKNMGTALVRYRQLLGGKNEPASLTARAILDELLTFRGSTPFQAAIWDASVEPPAFLSYDALVIAQSSEICLADWEQVEAELADRFPDPIERARATAQWRYALQRGKHPLVLYIDQFREERERLVLQIDHFEPSRETNCVLLLKGLSIKQPRGGEVSALNAILRRQPVVGYVTKRPASELRTRLRLPAFFPLLRLEDSRDVPYTLALGQAAMLLEAEAFKLGNRDEETAPIFC